MLALVSLTAIPAATAQTDPGVTITPASTPAESASVPARNLLTDPAALAGWLRDHNRDLRAASERVRQAEAEAAQSRLAPNPSLNGSLGDVTLGHTNPPGLLYSDTAIYSTSLSETVEIGKRGPRKRAAQLRLDAERQAYLDAVAQKVAEARAVLGRVAYLQARQQVLEDNLKSARQIEELQKARTANGDLSGSDLDRLLVDTMILEAEVARTRSEYDETLVACGALLFAPCAAPDTDLEALGASAQVPETPDIDAALERRPDLASIERERDAVLQDAVLARRRWIPDPNLSVGYVHDNLTISGDQPNTLQFGVGLTLPLFDRGQHDAQKARAHARELDETGSADRARARGEIEALLLRRHLVTTTLSALQGEALPKSKSVLDATVSAVGQGEMSMTDLLLARRTHTDLLLKVMDLQFDLFSVRNDLRRSLALDAEVARTLPDDTRRPAS